MAAAVATKRKTFSLETAYRDSLQIQLTDGSSSSNKKENIFSGDSLQRQLTDTDYRWQQL